MCCKMKIPRLIASIFIGTIFTVLFCLSISPLFSVFCGVLVLVMIIPLFVFLMQDKHIMLSILNISFFLTGIMISLAVEIRIDFIGYLFNLSNTEFSTGDGFGVIVYIPLYVCAFFLIVVLTMIVSFIRRRCDKID